MKDKLVVITGPTAVGKSNLAIELAKGFNGEIISADSMQIYKYMNIGTAKITKEETQGIPHYMLDILYPDEEFSVSSYQEMASKYISDINSQGKIPIIAGGTGLYINSIVYKLNFASVPPDTSIREKYEMLAEEYSNEYIHDILFRLDRESGERIPVNNRRRIIRALEIVESTGKHISESNKNFREENNDYDLTMICLNMDREKLYERINRRVDIMMESGLLDEVKSLLDMGYHKDLVSMKGIGYKEMIGYLEGDYSLKYAIDKIKQGSRNYAKRQLTWFRRDNRIKWLDVDSYGSFEELYQNAKEHILKEIAL